MESQTKGKIKKTLGGLLGHNAQSLFPELFQKKPAEEPAVLEAEEAGPTKFIVPPPDFFAQLYSGNQAEPAKIDVPLAPPKDTNRQATATGGRSKSAPKKSRKVAAPPPEETAPEAPFKIIDPPPPPDTSWLATAAVGGRPEEAENVPLALLALNGKAAAQQEMMEHKLAEMGYAVTTAHSAMQALERLDTTAYSLVFCSADAAFKEVRRFVDRLPADQRRRIYFVLVGADLYTFHDLEALALSVNLVINDRDLPSLELILPKGLHDYEELFRPLLDIIDAIPHK